MFLKKIYNVVWALIRRMGKCGNYGSLSSAKEKRLGNPEPKGDLKRDINGAIV